MLGAGTPRPEWVCLLASDLLAASKVPVNVLVPFA